MKNNPLEFIMNRAYELHQEALKKAHDDKIQETKARFNDALKRYKAQRNAIGWRYGELGSIQYANSSINFLLFNKLF